MYTIAFLIIFFSFVIYFYEIYHSNKDVFYSRRSKLLLFYFFLIFSSSSLFYLYGDEVKTSDYWILYAKYIAILFLNIVVFAVISYKSSKIQDILANLSSNKYHWILKYTGRWFIPWVILNLIFT